MLSIFTILKDILVYLETSGKEIDSMTEKTYEYYIEQERAIAE